MSDQITGYADALLAVARADGNVAGVKSELVAVSNAIEGNEELRQSLSNNLLPASTRNQILDDILQNKVTDTTRALAGMIISAGKGSAFGEIVNSFVSRSASAGGAQVATVRSAVALTEDQKTRLSQALKTSTGNDVELQVVVDPSVVGGAVTTIGDTVIDGSLRTRLNQMRDAL